MKGLYIEMKIPFGGNVLLLGCGSVSQCFQPLLMRHLEMDFSKLTIIDFEDLRHTIPDVLAAGANYVRHRINADNYAETFARYLRPGDLLIDLAWNIDTVSAIRWCHDHDVLYVNTSVELWDPYEHMGSASPTASTLYVRQLALEAMAASWSEPGATSVVDHGANPGLVSHWTKLALEDITKALINQPDCDPQRRSALEQAYTEGAYNRLAMLTGVKVIHISERDTQISDKPKRVDEFVNTWSIEGFYEEGVAPAEMGWGTHERTLPRYAYTHENGRGNQICLARMGMNTFVRSWVPQGEILGMVIRHGEAYTISDHLTVWEDGKAIYRPTVHYVYLPCDAAIASLHELRMNNYKPQSQVRIMTNEIVDGRDELGVLLLGHDLNGWWVGSQLDIHESRMLVPGQNATTLQVAASVLAAVVWMLRNPRRGFNVPDNLPHREILEIANPYLGPCPSIQTDWTPLKNRYDAFPGYGAPRPNDEDVWQFSTFLFE